MVDSRGRLLVAGSTRPRGVEQYTAYVIRILPNGSGDAGFGNGGEVVTDFGLPTSEEGSERQALELTSIIVDAKDRPVVAGSFAAAMTLCGYGPEGGPEPFVGRLTGSGAIDKSFAGTGYAVFKGHGGVSSLAQLPGGGTAVFTTPCSSGARVEWQPPLYSTLTASGKPSGLAAERGLPFSYLAPAIDRSGRVVELENPPPAAVEYEPDALLRFLPNGKPDPGFGRKGRVVLRKPREVSAFAVDAAGRPIVASSTKERTELRRFRLDGKLDGGFGPKGRLTAKVGVPSAVAFDADGRIYTVSLARSPSRTTVKVARFIPGP